MFSRCSAERDFTLQMVYCILAIGPYTGPKTHKLNYAHRQIRHTNNKTDKQITTNKQNKKQEKRKREADKTVTP